MYDFSSYKTFNELFRDLYYKKMAINDAEIRQNEFDSIVWLNKYISRAKKYIEEKNSLLNNVKNFYEGREKIIEGFKKGIFLLKSDDDDDDDDDDDEDDDDDNYDSGQQQASKRSTKHDVNAFNEQINKEEADINKDLFKKHFNFQRPSDLLKYLYKTNDREENNKLLSVINSRLQDLKEEIKEMSEKERKIEKPDKIVKIVKEILKFNKQKQEGRGLKILTPRQMLSRLPISLA